jgi:hypothetical protein
MIHAALVFPRVVTGILKKKFYTFDFTISNFPGKYVINLMQWILSIYGSIVLQKFTVFFAFGKKHEITLMQICVKLGDT